MVIIFQLKHFQVEGNNKRGLFVPVFPSSAGQLGEATVGFHMPNSGLSQALPPFNPLQFSSSSGNEPIV